MVGSPKPMRAACDADPDSNFSRSPLVSRETPLTIPRSREPGAGSREPGAGSREPGAGSREPGAGSREPGAGSREPGAGSREPGAGSREQGAGSREPGAGSREPGAGSREPGAGSREPGAGSREPGAGSREPGAGSREPGAGSRFHVKPIKHSWARHWLSSANARGWPLARWVYVCGDQTHDPDTKAPPPRPGSLEAAESLRAHRVARFAGYETGVVGRS
jgi:hypothetical protein